MEQKQKPTFRISFSEYSTFQQCPHKWFLNYMLKIPGDSNEELIFGSSIHNTIEEMLTNPNLVKLSKNINIVENIFKSNFKKVISEIEDIEFLKKINEAWVAPTFNKQAKALLLELDIHKRFSNYEFVDIEIQLDDMPIVEREDVIITYKGFIDLVLRNKKTGRYLILDWKTSRKKWKIKDKELDNNFYTQLKLYKYFYSIKKNIPIENIDVCFYNLPRDEPREQKQFNKEFSKEEIYDFIKLFSDNCEKIYDFDHFLLEKAKFISKKNYCSRCQYNNPTFCSDLEQYQIVDFNAVK